MRKASGLEIPRLQAGTRLNLADKINVGFQTDYDRLGQAEIAKVERFREVTQDVSTTIEAKIKESVRIADNLYKSKLEMDSEAQLKMLDIQTDRDLEKFNDLSTAYITTTAENIPAKYKAEFLNNTQNKATQLFLNKQVMNLEIEKKQEKESLNALDEYYSDKVSNFGIPKSELDRQLFQDQLQTLGDVTRRRVEAGIITDIEAFVQAQKIQENISVTNVVSASKDATYNGGNALNFLLRVSYGKSGIPEFDTLPENLKIKALNTGMQYVNAEIAKEKRNESLNEKYLKSTYMREYRNIIGSVDNGEISTTKDINSKLSTLKANATDVGDIVMLEKLEAYAGDRLNRKFTESDPQVINSLVVKRNDGTLSEEEVTQALGNGISTNDYNKFIEDIQASKSSILVSPTMKYIKTDWDTTFPTLSENEARYLANVRQHAISKGLPVPDIQEVSNKDLKIKYQAELHRYIIEDKTIVTEGELRLLSEELKTKMLIESGRYKDLPKNNAIDVTAPLKNEAKKPLRSSINTYKADPVKYRQSLSSEEVLKNNGDLELQLLDDEVENGN